MAKADSGPFSAEEKAAMRQAAAEKRRKMGPEELEADMLEKIAELEPDERVAAKRIHEIVKEVAPHLMGKTFYGMPGWADEKGKILVFFQNASKFKARYSTLGFQDSARLDDGTMWPVTYALSPKLSKADEKRIAALVKKAAAED